MSWKNLLPMLLLALSAQAWGGWKLSNDDSTLHFVSIKKGSVAEVHRFDRLDGAIGDDGAFTLGIDLASVDTRIPVRDERMRKLLFETDRFARATVEGRIDPVWIARLAPGERHHLEVELTLDLHGHRKHLVAPLTVVALCRGLLVHSRRPLIVDAADFGLTEGIEKLREVAGLSRIATAVPVSFELLFAADRPAHAVPPPPPAWRWIPRR